MTGKNVLVIDIGTGQCRAIVFNEQGGILAMEGKEWNFKPEPLHGGDAYSFCPEETFELVIRLIKKLLTEHIKLAETIGAVSVTSQREGMVYTDSDGKELYAAPNIDNRGEAVLHLLEPKRGKIEQITGMPLLGLFGLARLVWHKTNAGSLFEKIHKVMMISDWMIYRLGGEFATEPSVAGSSQMYDVKNNCFSKELMEDYGIPEAIFPKVLVAGTPLGGISEEVAGRTGLLAGTPLVSGGADTQAAAIGIGLRQGELAAIAGTTTPVVALWDGRSQPGNGVCIDCHVLKGTYLLEENALSTGLSLRWIKDLLYAGGDYAQAQEEAAGIVPGAGGLQIYMGSQISDADYGQGQGGFLFPVLGDMSRFTRAHFYRAALECNVFSIKANTVSLCRLLPQQGRKQILRICGGQSKSPLFNQILADCMNCEVVTCREKESTALGAAVIAAVTLGLYEDIPAAVEHMVHEEQVYQPNTEAVKAYQEIYQEWMFKHKMINQ